MSKQENGEKIMFLLNSIYFYLNAALILIEPNRNGFRLIVSKGKRNEKNKVYETVRGAKIAFIKEFGVYFYDKKPFAVWSRPYLPDRKWMEKNVYGQI